MIAEPVLIGIPGAGKTALAERLALAWQVGWVDTDREVSAVLGAPIHEIFAEPDGERRFRAAEEDVCLRLLQRPVVIALGSGAVTSSAVRDALRPRQTVWLDTSVRTATRRLGMLTLGLHTVSTIRDQLDADLTSRAGWYSHVANHVISTDQLNLTEVLNLLISLKEDQ